MMLLSRTFLMIIIVMTTNIYASIKCSEPKLSRTTHQDSLYHFKAVVTCELVGEQINLPGLKDAYKSEILDKKSQFTVHSQHDYDIDILTYLKEGDSR